MAATPPLCRPCKRPMILAGASGRRCRDGTFVRLWLYRCSTCDAGDEQPRDANANANGDASENDTELEVTG